MTISTWCRSEKSDPDQPCCFRGFQQQWEKKGEEMERGVLTGEEKKEFYSWTILKCLITNCTPLLLSPDHGISPGVAAQLWCQKCLGCDSSVWNAAGLGSGEHRDVLSSSCSTAAFPCSSQGHSSPGKSLPTHPLWSWSFPGWGRWRAWGTPCGWGWGGPCRRHHRQSGCSGSLWHPWHNPQHTLGKEVKMGRDQRKQQPKFTPGLRGEGKKHPASFHRIEDHGDNFN